MLVLAVLVVSYASSMRAYLEQKEHLEALRRSIADSRANIEALEREKRRWKDDAFVEAQARQRLSWVMPGEIGFQVIGDDGKPLDGGDTLSDPEAVTEANRPPWWQTAWGSVEAAGHPEDLPEPVEKIHAPKKKIR